MRMRATIAKTLMKRPRPRVRFGPGDEPAGALGRRRRGGASDGGGVVTAGTATVRSAAAGAAGVVGAAASGADVVGAAAGGASASAARMSALLSRCVAP